MRWTPRIEKAIKKAAVLHRAQTRRGSIDYPYITHLVSVATILAHYTSDEDILIAGLLHDTIEDTDYTFEQLEDDFGMRVRTIVDGVTEKKGNNGERLPWMTRKKDYLETLKNAPEESLLVSAADKIHNLRSLIEEHRIMGNEFWPMYARLTDPEAIEKAKQVRLQSFGDILAVLKARGGSLPIVKELEEVYEEARGVFT